MVNCPGGSSRSSGGQNDVSSGESSGESSGGESHAPSVQLITLDKGGQSGASTSGAAGQSSDVRSGGLNTGSDGLNIVFFNLLIFSDLFVTVFQIMQVLTEIMTFTLFEP
jgi:hypothetical protein